MDIRTLTTFFMWCTIINGTILLLCALLFMLAPDMLYRTQKRWFPISRETYNVIFYCFLGAFKIFYLVFNIVPYCSLLIMG